MDHIFRPVLLMRILKEFYSDDVAIPFVVNRFWQNAFLIPHGPSARPRELLNNNIFEEEICEETGAPIKKFFLGVELPLNLDVIVSEQDEAIYIKQACFDALDNLCAAIATDCFQNLIRKFAKKDTQALLLDQDSQPLHRFIRNCTVTVERLTAPSDYVSYMGVIAIQEILLQYHRPQRKYKQTRARSLKIIHWPLLERLGLNKLECSDNDDDSSMI